MEILEFIKDLDDEFLERFVKERIDFLEEDEEGLLPDTIGYRLNYNPSSLIMLKDKKKELQQVSIIDNYNGYIPKNTRIVYGMVYNPKTMAKSNGARYYYLDEDSYILEFCKFIRDKEINTPYMLFDYIFDFIKDYFGRIELIDREKMMNYLLKKDHYFYDPINENKYSMFKGKGNAMCSEIGVMAQNILSFLGFDVKYVMGTIRRISEVCEYIPEFIDDEEIIIKSFTNIEDIKEELEVEKLEKRKWEKKKAKFKPEGHAYNMITIAENENIESILIDFSASVYIYDIEMNEIGEAPFIHYLDKEKEYVFSDMRLKDKTIESRNYSYIVQNPISLALNEAYVREYSTSSSLYKASEDIRYKKNKIKNLFR